MSNIQCCGKCGVHWDDHYWNAEIEMLLCPVRQYEDEGDDPPPPVEDWSAEDEFFWQGYCKYMRAKDLLTQEVDPKRFPRLAEFLQQHRWEEL